MSLSLTTVTAVRKICPTRNRLDPVFGGTQSQPGTDQL